MTAIHKTYISHDLPNKLLVAKLSWVEEISIRHLYRASENKVIADKKDEA